MKRLLVLTLVFSPCTTFAQVPSCEDSLTVFRQYAKDISIARNTLEGQLSELRVSFQKTQDELQALKTKEVKKDAIKNDK